jgi:hypothetical protein
MTDVSEEWDLLSSNESGSDVYWPESDFGDTASIAESLGFTDGDFADELGDPTDLGGDFKQNLPLRLIVLKVYRCF